MSAQDLLHFFCPLGISAIRKWFSPLCLNCFYLQHAFIPSNTKFQFNTCHPFYIAPKGALYLTPPGHHPIQFIHGATSVFNISLHRKYQPGLSSCSGVCRKAKEVNILHVGFDAALCGLWVTVTWEFGHKEWLLSFQTLQPFDQSDIKKKETDDKI